MSPLERGLDGVLDLVEEERGHLRRLCEATPERLAPRRTVLRQGARHDRAYVVASGWLAEHRTLRNGRRQILNLRLAGDLVGVDGLAYSRAIFATSTLTEVELLPVSLEAFERLQREAPRLGTALLVQALRTEAILHEWEVNLGRRRAVERLAHLLLEVRRRLRLRGLAEGPRFALPLTQGELADCVGVSHEHLNRMMGRLRDEGLARMSDGEVAIEDEAGLVRLAGFDPFYVGGKDEG